MNESLLNNNDDNSCGGGDGDYVSMVDNNNDNSSSLNIQLLSYNSKDNSINYDDNDNDNDDDYHHQRAQQAKRARRPTVKLTLPAAAAAASGGHHEKKKGSEKVVAVVPVESYHLMSEDEVKSHYQIADFSMGLSDYQVKSRRKKDGLNVISPKRNYLKKVLKFLGHFCTGFCLILWPAAILSILAYKPLGEPEPDITNLVQGIVLIIVIFINAGFEIVQEFMSGRIMKSISNMLPPTCKVLRDGGHLTQIPVKDLVVGDVVHLEMGDVVPADLRLIECTGLKLDTSMLTGESEPVSCSVKKQDKMSHHQANSDNVMEAKNVAFMGTSSVEGIGVGVVVNTGNRTVMGHITEDASQSKQANSSSALHKEITRFVFAVAALAVMTGCLFVLIWGVYLKKKHPKFMNTSEIISTALAASVAFVPESLPLCVILTLTMIARKMGQQKVIVKSLMTVETLGCVNVICSDKTGTLTQNRMSVMHLYIGQRLKSVGRELLDLHNRGNTLITELIRVCSLCNRAVFQEPVDESLPIAERPVMGDASDTAMLRFAEDYHSVSEMRREYKTLALLPFNSKNKYMLTLLKQPSDMGDNRPLLLMKGAAEIMAARCSTVMLMDGKEVPMTEQIKEDLARQQEELGQCGERVLALCRRYLDEKEYPADSYEFRIDDDVNFPTDELCLIGMISLLDKPRPEAAYAIGECAKAGIRVSMVTGDHPTTAVSIARMVGIVGPKSECRKFDPSDSYNFKYHGKKNIPCIKDRALAITGADIAKGLTENDWDYIVAHQELVFARTTPEHKLAIVQQFQKRKNVVAVTGDGTNDAPAMKISDVGVAMGAGSEVARNTADLVLMDNNFASLIVGINYGRLVYENLKKVVIYLLPAGTMCELAATAANVFFGLPKMISPMLMIYHALLTETANSMTLIFEQPEPEIMDHPPRSITGEHVVNFRLLFQAYIFIGIPQVLCIMTMWFWYMFQFAGFRPRELIFLFEGYKDGFKNKTEKQLLEIEYIGQCVFFAALVFAQFGNLLATRTRRASFFQQPPYGGEKSRNVILFVGMFLSLIFAIMVVHIPVAQYLMDTRTIPYKFWFAPIAFTLLIFVLDEIRKFGTRLLPRAFILSW